MSFLLLQLITLYQRTLSPDHGWFQARFPYGCCCFYPSCSSYAHQAIERHGAIKGTVLAIARLLRCHPWSHGGIDHIPA